MKKRGTWRAGFWIPICLGLLALPSEAEGRELQGVVFHESQNGRTPEAGVVVRLVETGASTYTNEQGEFRFRTASSFGPEEKVTLEVIKKGWRIRYPYDGEVRIPADPKQDRIQVELLPEGSLRFFDDGRIERLLTQTAKETVHRPLGAELEKNDFIPAIRHWASEHGLNADRTEKVVDRWVREVAATGADDRRRGLAAWYENDFQNAAAYFKRAAWHTFQELKRVDYVTNDLKRKHVDNLWLEGTAFKGAFQFGKAASAYWEALRFVQKEQDRASWATIQNHLGLALHSQGVRTEGETGTRYLKEAVEAYRLALSVESLPQDRAATQTDLGNALREQGARTGGEEGMRLLEEAVAAYELSLKVRTREDLPHHWAATQSHLGDAYQYLERYEKAVAIYRQILDEFPNFKDIIHKLSFVYLNRLFDHEAAYFVMQGWLAKAPDDPFAHIRFPELLFTTYQFEACGVVARELSASLMKTGKYPRNIVVLLGFSSASRLAEGQISEGLEELRELRRFVSDQGASFQTGWYFDGALHFVRHTPTLEERQAIKAVLLTLGASEKKEILEGLDAVIEDLEQRVHSLVA